MVHPEESERLPGERALVKLPDKRNWMKRNLLGEGDHLFLQVYPLTFFLKFEVLWDTETEE